MPVTRALLLLVPLAAIGCAPSDQRRAEQAIAGAGWAGWTQCLKPAHWTAATRTGAFLSNPMVGAPSFVALDRPVARPFRIEEHVFAPVLVGSAQQVLGKPLQAFEESYRHAGSPLAPPSLTGDMLGIGRPLYAIDKQIDAGWIRGTAAGWLSREDDLYCGTDSQNGRYFVISEFKPTFPLRP